MEGAFAEIESHLLACFRQLNTIEAGIRRLAVEGLCELEMIRVRQEVTHASMLLQGLGRQLEHLAEEGSQR